MAAIGEQLRFDQYSIPKLMLGDSFYKLAWLLKYRSSRAILAPAASLLSYCFSWHQLSPGLQNLFVGFTDGGPGQGIHKLYVGGHFIRGQAFPAVGDDFLGSHSLAFF